MKKKVKWITIKLTSDEFSSLLVTTLRLEYDSGVLKRLVGLVPKITKKRKV